MTKNSKDFNAFKENLGRRIRVLRDKKKYSQEELAALVEMDRVSIGYIEQGRRTPKLSTLYKIADKLDIEVGELFRKK